MENATKALLIAGSVLLLILVLTFMTYLFNKVGGQTAKMYGNLEESDISEFNQKFFNYDNKTDLKIQDVVSIISLVRDNNKRNTMLVEVVVKLSNDPNALPAEINNEINKNDSGYKEYIKGLLSNNSDKRYSCKVEYAANSKIVGEIVLKALPGG